MKIFLTILLSLFLSGCVLTEKSSEKNMDKQIIINNQPLKIEVARTNVEMAKGLGGRESLCDNCGLLFEYADYQIRHFWMKEMKFPIDIVWIKDDEVVGFEQKVPLFDESEEISRMVSPDMVNRVLELNAGWTEQNQLKVGDKIVGLD